MTKRTLLQLFQESVDEFQDRVYMRERHPEGWVDLSFRGMAQEGREVAGCLLDEGLRKGERAAILAEGRNSWIGAEYGIFLAGAIAVPVSVKIKEPAELLFRFRHSGSRILITTARQLDKVLPLIPDLPDLKAVFLMDPVPDAAASAGSSVALIPWIEVRRRGKEYNAAHPGRLAEIEAEVSEDDPATLSYTSGTSAEPKGILLSHRNYRANVEDVDYAFPLPEPFYTLLILPWDHSFGHTVGLYSFMKKGSVIAAVEPGKGEIGTIRNIPRNIQETGPTYLLVVPALVDSFRRNIAAQIRQKGAAVQALFRATIALGTRLNGDGYRRRRDPVSLLQWPFYALLRGVISSAIRKSMGGRLLFFVSGGSACSIDHVRWFTALGIPVYQGYGMSETAPIIASNTTLPGWFKMGTVGRTFPWVKLRIEGEGGEELPVGQTGEICVKGDCLMLGYWRNEEATRESMVGGWFHTGDLGMLDSDGFLWVTGRIKSLLVGQNGEKYSPEALEEHLSAHVPLIRQVMLYNQQNPFTAALIVPDRDAAEAFLKENGLSADADADLDRLIGAMRDSLLRYRKDPQLTAQFMSEWAPKTFAILPEAFSEENGMVNSSMKMVRRRIVKACQERIDGLYGAEENPVNPANRAALRAWIGKGRS